MSTEPEGHQHVEDLLRSALSARADQVTQDRLSPAGPPPASGGGRWATYLTVIGAAAAAVAVGVLVLGGWRPFGTGGSTAAAGSGQPGTVATGSGTAGSGIAGSATGSPGGAATASPSDQGSASPTGSASTSASASPKVPVCVPEAMSAFVLPDTATRMHGGGMNHVGATVGLTNTGTTPCRIYGYLGVGFYRSGVLVSAVNTDRGSTYYATDPGPTSFLLAPGGSGYAELDWSTADGTLPVVPFDQIRLILPDQKRQLPISYSATIGGHAHELRESALTPAPLPLNG